MRLSYRRGLRVPECALSCLAWNPTFRAMICLSGKVGLFKGRNVSHMEAEKKTGSDIDTRPIPRFRGESSDERLQKACDWVALHCPGRQLTLEELGLIMGVTRERVRQIEARALRKLRHPSRMRFLRELRR